MCVGSRWEAQTGQSQLWKECEPFVTAFRFGGWDVQPRTDTPMAEQLASLAKYVAGISVHSTKGWLPALDYVPGRNDKACGATSSLSAMIGGQVVPAVVEQTDRGPRVKAFAQRSGVTVAVGGGVIADDNCLRPQLEAFRVVWDRVLYVEFDSLDEYGGKASDVVAAAGFLRSTISAMGLPPKPFEINQATPQLWEPEGVARCHAADICSTEAYADPPGTGPQAGEIAKVNSELDRARVAISPQPMIVVGMGYARNGAYLSKSNNEAVLLAAYQWCHAHEPQCVGVDPFSWGRGSGSREQGFGPYLTRGMGIILGRDPGKPQPEDLPAPTPVPTPIVGPGALWLPRTNFQVAADAPAVVVTVNRKDGHQGAITLTYSVTCDTGGADCTASDVPSAMVTFPDGATAAAIAIPVPLRTLPGVRVWWVRLLSVTGGATLIDHQCRATVPSDASDPAVSWWASSTRAFPGNPLGMWLFRGDCRAVVDGTWCIEDGGTLVEGVDYNGGWHRCASTSSHPAWSMASGACELGIQFNTLASAVPGHSGVLRLSSSSGVGRLSETTVEIQ
jgi:hypothetical protein